MERGREPNPVVKLGATSGTTPLDPSGVCPRCSQTLKERACKLICARCGYYLSCTDF